MPVGSKRKKREVAVEVVFGGEGGRELGARWKGKEKWEDRVRWKDVK